MRICGINRGSCPLPVASVSLHTCGEFIESKMQQELPQGAVSGKAEPLDSEPYGNLKSISCYRLIFIENITLITE